MTSVSTGGGGSVLIQEFQTKYALVTAEAIYCKSLLIILEAGYRSKRRSRRSL
jgi:hypothetical protein